MALNKRKFISAIYTIIIACILCQPVNTSSIANCIVYSSDGTKCNLCMDYYRVYNGTCYPTVPNCKQYSSATLCLQCQLGTFLWNSICCDKNCLSQIYVSHDNAAQQINQVIVESQILQGCLSKAIQQVNSNSSLTNNIKLLNVSYKKYHDVSRFYIYLQIINMNDSSYQRYVFDYHFLLNQYILIDRTSYLKPQNKTFIQTTFDIVKSFSTSSFIVKLFPSYYAETDPNLALIKYSTSLNKLTTYQILIHNQNVMRGLYSYNNITVLLYQTILSPQFFRSYIIGSYIIQALNQSSYLAQCKSLMQKNQSYIVNSSIRAVEISYSTNFNDPLRVLFYSDNNSSIIKSQFEVYFNPSSDQQPPTSISKISPISTSSQLKPSSYSSKASYSTFYQTQSNQINKILALIFSPYNSTLQFPSNYADNISLRTSIQWKIQIQEWKTFNKYHLQIMSKDYGLINATVVYFNYFNQYRIDKVVRVAPVKMIYTRGQLGSGNNIQAPYERTIEGWQEISARVLDREDLRRLVQIVSVSSNHKALGSNSNITKISQKSNFSSTNFTTVSQNTTHSLILNFSNILSSNNLSLTSFAYLVKNQINIPPQYSVQSNSANGITVYYAQNTKQIAYTNFNVEPAKTLYARFMQTVIKYQKDPNTIKGTFQNRYAELLSYYKTPAAIVEFHQCPTSPITYYYLQFAKYTSLSNTCGGLSFYEILDSITGQKKMLLHGYGSQGSCVVKMNMDKFGHFSMWNFLDSWKSIRTDIQHMSSSITFPVSFNDSIKAWDAFLLSQRSSQLYNKFKTFKLQNYSRTTTPQVTYQAQIINYNLMMTDPATNQSYQFVYYFTAPYQRNISAKVQTYAGSLSSQYFALCPPINLKAPYITLFNQAINPWTATNSSQFFQRYNKVVPRGYLNESSTAIKNTLYSLNDQTKLNNFLPALNSIYNLTTSLFSQSSVYEVKQYLQITFGLFKLYLWRLNFTSLRIPLSLLSLNTTLPIQNLIIIQSTFNSTSTPQLLSWSPFINKSLQNFSLKPSPLSDYLQISEMDNNFSYLLSLSGIANSYQQYYKDNIDKTDSIITKEITNGLLEIWKISALKQQSYVMTFKNVFFNSINMTNQTSFINFLIQVQNKTVTIATADQVSTSTKSYYIVKLLVKANSTASSINSTNLLQTAQSQRIYNLYVYVLNIKPIDLESQMGKFIVGTLYPQMETVANYTVQYNYKYYNDSNTVPSIDGSSPSPIGNTLTSSNGTAKLLTSNSTQTTQQFPPIVSQAGNFLQSGQLQCIKYLPDSSSLTVIPAATSSQSSPPLTDQQNLYNNWILKKILQLLKPRFKQQTITTANLNSTVLLLEKLNEQIGLKQYHFIVRVNVTVLNNTMNKTVTSAADQITSIFIIRLTYIILSSPYRIFDMGSQLLPTQSYSSLLNSISTASLSPSFFKPLSIASNLNYLSSFIYTSLDLINQYILKNFPQPSTQSAVKITRIYYRNFINGGFYKIIFQSKSRYLGIGYMIESDYDYLILMVKITTVLAKTDIGSSITNQTATSNSTSSTTSTNPINTITTSSSNSSTSSSNITVINNSMTNTKTKSTNSTYSSSTSNTSIPLPLNNTLQLQLSSSSNPLYVVLLQILTKLRQQFTLQLQSSILKQFSIKQFSQGQYYHLGLQKASSDFKFLFFYDVMIFRCNVTQCSVYKGVNGSLYIVNFVKNTVSLYDNMITNTSVINYLPWNNNATVTNTSSSSNTNKYFYYSNQSSPSLTYYLNTSQSLSILSLFEQMISNPQQAALNLSRQPAMLKYQKYSSFLKQYQSLILTTSSTKIITKSDINFRIIKVINFVKIKYFKYLENAVLLAIVQSNQYVNNTVNYGLYMFIQSGITNWTIYKIVVCTKEFIIPNVQIRIVSFSEFAKNDILIINSNINNFTNTITNADDAANDNSVSTDIAFGYVPLPIQQAVNDPDIQYVISQLKLKLPSVVTPLSLLKSAQKLQLKNGTINYKFTFQQQQSFSLQSNTSPSIIKIIAVYKKETKIVEILNKIYIPEQNQSFRPALSTDINNSTVFNNVISLIYQLHTNKQISPNEQIKIQSIELAQQPQPVLSSIASKSLKYRIQFGVSQLFGPKKYSIIIQYNPLQKSLIQKSFNQIIQIAKDSTYRLNQYQQVAIQTFIKLTPQQISTDQFFPIIQTKLKQQTTYYCRFLQVYKKFDSIGYTYKIVFLGDSLFLLNNLNGNIAQVPNVQPMLLFQAILYIEPVNSFIQIRQYPKKLDLESQFDLKVGQGVIRQEDLNNIANNISTMINLNLTNREQLFFTGATMKNLFDGLVIKLTFYANKTINRTESYQTLIFKQPMTSLAFSQLNLSPLRIWSLKPINLPNFQKCSQTLSCTKCLNPTFYTFSNRLCLLSISNCIAYSQIDPTKNILKCGICSAGYQLFDNICISKTQKPDVFVL